jgi:hypothetical protein
MAGCVTQAGGGGSTAVPRGAPDAADTRGPHVGESMSELAVRLRALVRQRGGKLHAAASDAAACEDLCSLATSICEVQEKMCLIADEHPADGEYQNLCREAQHECREAQASCIDCVESNSGPSLQPAG